MRSLIPMVLLGLILACGSNPRLRPEPKPPLVEPEPEPPPPPIDAERMVRELDAYVDAVGKGWGAAFQLSGYVFVAQGDKVIYSKGFGYADHEAKRPNTAETSFRIGSVTKQFTAAAVLKLEEEGKLSTGDTISKHIPEYPRVGGDITLHHLLTHTSGIPNYTNDSAVMDRRSEPIALMDLLKTFWEKPLDFGPGDRFEYSNSNYAVLGVVIERASGMSYEAYMQEKIFGPAGLTRTVVGDARDAVDRAEGYTGKGAELEPALDIDMGWATAAGAVRSTAHDLWKWHQVLQRPGFLTAESLEKLYKPERDDYAYGWLVTKDDGKRIVAHNGGIDGFLTSYVRIPELDVVIVAWSNNDGVDPGGVAEAAKEVALGNDVDPPKFPEPSPVEEAVARRLEGRYALSQESRDALTKLGAPDVIIKSIRYMDVFHTPAGLVLDAADQPPVPLTQKADGSFANDQVRAVVKFEPAGGEKPATGMTIVQGMTTITFERDANAR